MKTNNKMNVKAKIKKKFSEKKKNLTSLFFPDKKVH